MGQVLHRGLLQGWEPVGGSSVGVETSIDNELMERFLEGDRGGLLRRSWVDGFEERIWKPSLRICLRW